MSLKIKSQYKDVVIGFNGSSLPLGSRTDTHKLYQLAQQQNLQHFLQMFEDTPSEKALEKIKEDFFDKKQADRKLLRASANKKNE